ncbi:methyl-accepting chemotaxis protein [Rhizobium sp. SL86]|uniref:methyl-accepting chemotaxis protein n=1 Tax=Rhizobium sp. SL86 TaxID=2995148 RepID=UPI0022749099|nr:HAMP domain-containing methyl-accepting chemotaxis protein [Rhizobium sp. SL86]MCY1668910.1 HAMP domain-containing methyl-accepting chemotaxis protein [Rhizobium sp. SL86]
MGNLPILAKFFIIMGMFALFALGVTINASIAMKDVDADYNALIDHDSTASVAIARANRNLQSMRAAIGDIIMATDQAVLNRSQEEFTDTRARFAEMMDSAIAALPQERQLQDLKAEGLRIVDVSCRAVIEAGMATTDPVQNQKIQAQFYEKCQPDFLRLGDTMTQNTMRILKSATEKGDALTAKTSSTVITMLVIISAGIVAVCAFGFMIIRLSVIKPIHTLASTMGVLANGDLTVTVEGAERRDEVGTMARAVQVFKDNGTKARELEVRAIEERAVTEAERRNNAEADRARAAAMEQATAGLAEGLHQLADGNLAVQLPHPFSAEFEGLRNDFNAAATRLKDTLTQVASSAVSIDSGSRELSQSAGDLSKRTEQQAASLEQTAAALDQITANVSNASKRTDEARTVAVEANRAAHQSGRVVADAVDAMQRIEQSSNQISSIIGVIDEIAFQTNLLALNAGVEAARAGEAGKGFAVVAQEVRELAQRSAQAAKEIKDLIRTSADQVDNGVRLVKATGEALKVIEGHVVSINTQLDAIATSAKEQSVGLSEVNTAVNQMDQVTQQNAAMVEEATAASTGLAGEAEKLRQLISRFQLQGGAAAHAPLVASASRNSPAPSPARRLVSKVARAVGGGGAAAESWEEF